MSCGGSGAPYDRGGRAKALLRALVPPVVVSVVRRVKRRFGVSGVALSSPDRHLSDGVVELRPIEARDLDMIERAARDSDVRRGFWLSGLSPSEYLARYRDASREGSAAAFAICDVGGESYGFIMVELRPAARADVGYWLLPEGRGRLRATRALRLLSHWALRQPCIARLELSTSPQNVASQRVAERSGFQREGVLRSYHEVSGRRADAVFFSLLPGDIAEPAERAEGDELGSLRSGRAIDLLSLEQGGVWAVNEWSTLEPVVLELSVVSTPGWGIVLGAFALVAGRTGAPCNRWMERREAVDRSVRSGGSATVGEDEERGLVAA